MLPGIASASRMSAETSSYELSYCGSFEVANKASTGSASIDIGAAHTNREIFLVCTTGADSDTLVAASTTVNGVAVTKATSEFTSAAPAPIVQSCAFAAVPNGAGFVTVTATYSGGLLSGALVAVYRVVNRPGKGNNETDASTAYAGTGYETSVTIDGTTINAGGIWFGVLCVQKAPGVPTPPSGTTADVDDSPGGTTRYQSCSRLIQANSTTPSDTWSTSPGSNQELSASSWAFA